MFESIMKFFNKVRKKEEKVAPHSKEAAKERLHLVLMQDRANVSADFLELMKQEIIEVIKKYIDIDEGAIDVRLTNKENEDRTNGAPALYANIPILNIKNEARKIEKQNKKEGNDQKESTKKEEDKTEESKDDTIKSEEKEENKEENNKTNEKEENENKDIEKKQNDQEEKNINEKEIAEEKETKEQLNQNKKNED